MTTKTTPKECFEWLETAILRGEGLDRDSGYQYAKSFWNGCLERLEKLKGIVDAKN